MSNLNIDQKIHLITNGLQEVIGQGEDKMRTILAERDLRVYWGTAPTGRPHIGYLVPLIKIAHFLQAGCQVTILFADLHAFLDSMKSTWEQLEFRVQYYELVIKQVLTALNVDITKLNFVRGTSFQLSSEYTLDMYKLQAKMRLYDARKAGAEVVKQAKDPLMSSLLYPSLQFLDEKYLGTDIQFGGNDQRKLFTGAMKFLPKIGYKSNIHLLNPMVPAFTNVGPKDDKEDDEEKQDTKMSSSNEKFKIDFLDSKKAVNKKIGGCWCLDGTIEGCALFQFYQYAIFPMVELSGENQFVINRPEQYGGNITFDNYEQLIGAFEDGSLSSVDLKGGLSNYLNDFLDNVRPHFQSTEMKQLIKKAY